MYNLSRQDEIKMINLQQGDCLELMKGIPDKSIDMIFCDLPYGTTHNKWDSIIPLDKLWREYHRIVKENGAMVFTASGLFTAQLMISNSSEYKYKYVWEKSKATNFLNAKRQPLRKHEDVLVFYKKQPTYHPQMTKGEAYFKGIRKNQVTGSYGEFKPVLVKSEGLRYPVDVFYFKTAESEGAVIHPTQKPVALLEYLIKTYTNKNETVLDNTMGSGSTGVACVNTGRNFIGMELDEEYFNKAKNRIEKVKEATSTVG